ncbi:hypothetical protein [Halorientalis pallida]|uniref:Sulfatase n=1 Tax=Halorientalis pallida TaxID=2479928 RepID=A0A498KRD3_9EURY|nr:hypothetical protein [Halorientalis pallida]RXK46942.1 hypothetical protein EAF64_17500 [Halorientalis pallida]
MIKDLKEKWSRLQLPLENWGWRGYPMVASMWFHRWYNQDISETSIWDRDWDLLVVLDACRVDWMNAVESEYSFVDGVDSVWSVGSHSEEWLKDTFADGPDHELERTAYVSANHFVDKHISPERLAAFDNVNNYLGADSDHVVAPAHMVTDRAVDVARSSSFDRLVVHYMQPHKPFFEQVGDRRDVEPVEWSIGRELYHNYFRGDITSDQLSDGFVDNLRYALDEVYTLLENVDAEKAVITADHGQALGERFLWDHSPGVRHPVVRRVPWVETTAVDRETLKPTSYEQSTDDENTVEERLEHLGYR